jgi:hypothetical protein
VTSPTLRATVPFAAGLALLAAGCGPIQQTKQASHSPVISAAPAASAAPSPSASSSSPPRVGSVANCPRGRIVTEAAQLVEALMSAAPGDVILLAPGAYQGQFVASTPGTSDAPITLCGSPDAVLDGGDIKLGYTLHLNGASWWRVMGFTIQGGQKGVVLDQSNHVLISGLYVHDIGDEGIHLRTFSSDNTVENVKVRNTGLLVAKFGEGIYVGSAHSNWCKYTSCNPDTSDRNVIRNNDVSQSTAENIDIKEGTTGGLIVGNHLSGDGMDPSGATAWINVKGNAWTITGNIGVHSIKDGFQVHQVYNGWGRDNVFKANHAEVDGPGFGF